jgi:7-cyano-7-deazaguanine synthase
MTASSAVVLLSGGLDSTTSLAHTLNTGTEVRAAVFCDYGQRHVRERDSALAVAARYGVPVVDLDLRGYGASVASALTLPEASIPHGHYAQDNMVQTVVPGRNAVMLSAAGGVAQSWGAQTVVTAVHAGDHPIYADCRPEFIEAMCLALSAGYGVGVSAPFVHWSKADIATEAHRLGAPAHLTWSCYEGGDVHCGRCGTCVERAEAFHLAGVPDPTEYADPDFWRTAVSA